MRSAMAAAAAARSSRIVPPAKPSASACARRTHTPAASTRYSDWAGAAGVLKEALSADPGNANYHNLYAYAVRKGASPDMNLVFKHYNEALRIDPKHRGAHEYVGEAYLMVGNVAKAKEHLGALDKLCFFPCAEYADLKKAIAEYEKKR